MRNEFDNVRSVLQCQFSRSVDWLKADVESVTGGFSGAGVFRIKLDDADFCLRSWPDERTSETRLLAIHQLLARAQDCGLTVIPVPLKSDFGRTLAEVNGGLWQLEPWMPGDADFLTRPEDQRLRSAMTQLARFNNAVRDWVPGSNVKKWFQPFGLRPCPTITNRLRMIDGYASSLADFEIKLAQESDTRFQGAGARIAQLFRSAHADVKRELAAVEGLPVPLQPCIRDLWHDHLLFRSDELSGIVDFGTMATDSVSCDLSRLLGSLFGDDFSAWQQAIAHYESVRTLTETEHRLLRPLDRSSVLLSGMTWLKRRYVLRNTPKDLSRICDRLDGILGRLSSLVSNF